MRLNGERGRGGAHWLVLRVNRVGCLLGIALLAAGPIAIGACVFLVGRFLTVDDELSPADAIVVLATGAHRTRWQSEHGLRPSALDIEQQSE